MCFNKIKFVLISLLILILISCSNDEIKNDKGIVVNLAYDTNCFDGFSSRWSEWSEGRGDENKVELDFNCLSDGIAYFLLRVRGDKQGSYSAQEMYNFTEKFFKDADISKKLIEDLLVIKSWIIGGSAQEISFVELNKISWAIRSSKSDFKLLTPFAEKLFFKESEHLITDEDALIIKKSFGSLFKNIKDLTEKADIAVSKESFEEKVNQVIIELKYEPISAENVHNFWSVVALSLGFDENAPLKLKPESGFIDLAHKAYYIALRLKYGVIDHGWRALSSHIHLDSVVNESLVLLKKVIENQDQGVFTKNRLALLMLKGSKFLDVDFEISISWLEDIIQILFDRYFDSESLGPNEIQVLADEWSKFGQFYTETLVLQGLGFSGSLIQGQNFVSLSDLNRRALDFKWPMLTNTEGYVLNSLKPKEIVADYGNLFWVNWQRALAGIFLKMYSEDPLRKMNLTGITIKELETGYADVFKILNAIEYLGDDEESSWFRIFNEANLFVPRAKPDQYLGFEEGVDYFALLFSGIAFSGDINQKLKQACVPLTKNCQLDWFKNSDLSVWGGFAPDFQTYLATADRNEWLSFSEGLEQMARETIQAEPFTRSDFLSVSIATHYIEIFLRRYDTNLDLKIDFRETVNSFEDFKFALLSLPQIKGTEAESDPVTLLAFYTFFLRRGRLPRQVLGQYVELFGWLKRVEGCVTENADGSFESKPSIQGCEYDASRANLMKILAFLSNSI